MEDENKTNAFTEDNSSEPAKAADNTGLSGTSGKAPEDAAEGNKASRYIPYTSSTAEETVILRPAAKTDIDQGSDGRYMPYISVPEETPEPEICAAPVSADDAPLAPNGTAEAFPEEDGNCTPCPVSVSPALDAQPYSAQNPPCAVLNPEGYPYAPVYTADTRQTPSNPPEYYKNRTLAGLILSIASPAFWLIAGIVQIAFAVSMPYSNSYAFVYIIGIILSAIGVTSGIVALAMPKGAPGAKVKTAKSKWITGLAVTGIVLCGLAMFSNIVSYGVGSVMYGYYDRYSYGDYYYDDTYYDNDYYNNSYYDDSYHYDNRYYNGGGQSENDEYKDWLESYLEQAAGHNEV